MLWEITAYEKVMTFQVFSQYKEKLQSYPSPL